VEANPAVIAESTTSPVAQPRFDSVVNWPALGAVVFWSAMSPFAKWALEEFPALAYTAFRPVIAAVLLFAVLAIRKQPILVERRDLRRILLAGTLGMGLSQLCYISGLARTSVTHNVILISCSPLLAAGYHWLVKRERLDPRSAFAVLGGFAGVVLLVASGGGSGGASLLGDVLSLGAAVTWMAATIWPAPLLAKYGALRTTVWMLSASILITLPVSVSSVADSLANPPSAAAWGSLLYSAVFGILIGNSLWQRAVQQVGASRTLIYLYLEPVGALALAALFLGERLGPLQALGGLLALAGVVLVRKT
jgi:drug/metabolite transporter (DMT)-like permease